MIKLAKSQKKAFNDENILLFFSSSSQKDIWWDKLNGLIKQERRHNPPSTNIQLGYFDQATNFEHVSLFIQYSECQTEISVAGHC